MNSQLQLLDHWLQFNKFLIKCSKTHFMLFTGSNLNTQNICIRNVHLERVDQTKFSGIIVTSEICFKGLVDRLS